MSIVIKSDQEVALMREAGRIVAKVLGVLKSQIKPGMRTKELDIIAGEEAAKLGSKPSFKGYQGYPANLCVSVNDEIVHGIPGEKVLNEGDIVSLDFGVIYKEFQGDSAITVGVGKISPESQRLMDTTEGALHAGIAAARENANMVDISAAIEKYAESRNYSLVREYTGHGIGRDMHEDPQVPNCTRPAFGISRGKGPLLVKGMTLALEPMVNVGGWMTKRDGDGWTVRTKDGSLSAHFEHTIAITNGEPQILTEL